jgi:hypothetical protein
MMGGHVRMYMVYSPRHATTVEATSPTHAVELAQREGLINPEIDAHMVAEAVFIEGVLSVIGEPYGFQPTIIRAETGIMYENDPVEDPKEIDYCDGQVHITAQVESPDFTPKPLRDRGVFIVGYGASRPLIHLYRKRDPDAEIWTINSDRVEGATRHFQIHSDEKLAKYGARHLDLSDLEAKGVQIYTARNYPFKEVRRVFHHSTADYMLALADLEGFKRVYLPGMDFGGNRKAIEMHSARYWFGVIEGKGGKVIWSPLSRVFQGVLYR